MEKEIRQRCPLSSMLFNLIIVNIKKGLKKDEVGKIKLRRKKLKVLGYVDDLVILTEDKKGMKRLMKRLEKYLDRKKLMLSTEKTKVIRKRERKRRKVKW